MRNQKMNNIKTDYKKCRYFGKKACISCDRQMHDCQQGMILKSPAELREEGRREERERIEKELEGCTDCHEHYRSQAIDHPETVNIAVKKAIEIVRGER